MNQAIVHASNPVTLVGGGAASAEDVQAALALAPQCVAADGGLSLALAAGARPLAVIGDFDSVAPADLAQMPAAAQFPIPEQDSTDFDKALRNITAPVVLAVGFLGARVDHQLAALHVLVARAERACILIGGGEVICHLPPRLHLPTQAGEIVSLFPMSAVMGRSDGLEWPIGGLAFDPVTRVGTSNRATGAVTLEMDAPGMLAILPRRLLGDLTQALASLPPDGRWTVP